MGEGDDHRLNPYLAQLLQALGVGSAVGVTILSVPAAYKETIAGLLFSHDPFGVFLGLLLYVLVSVFLLVGIVRGMNMLRTELELDREAPKPPPKRADPEAEWSVPPVQFPEQEPPKRRRKEVK